MRVEPYGAGDLDDLARLRAALWPEQSLQAHRLEIVAAAEEGRGWVALLARADDGAAVGFAEATLRHDYVNGCETTPVAFLEGIYVDPEARRHGAAAALCRAVETWARGLGCTELGSDALLENAASHAFHAAVGFEARERVVCFRKRL
jgi:aminoglycoside 6'-N-acetyltransferase I